MTETMNQKTLSVDINIQGLKSLDPAEFCQRVLAPALLVIGQKYSLDIHIDFYGKDFAALDSSKALSCLDVESMALRFEPQK